jgi:hypothetical protein
LLAKAGCGPRADRATVDAEAHRQTFACTAGSVLNAPPALAGTLAWRRSWIALSIPIATRGDERQAQYSVPLPAGKLFLRASHHMQNARESTTGAPSARTWSLRTSPRCAATGRGGLGDWVIGEHTGGRRKTTGKWSDDP